MANTVRVATQVTGVSKASSDVDKLRDRFDRLQKTSAKGLAIGVGAGLGLGAINLAMQAVQGVTEEVFKSIDAGSDLNETMSKSGVVFGQAGDQVSKWGDQTAAALGLSKKNAVEAAATFGNLFRGLGQGEAASAKMSERLVGLAGDLASFNNIDPTEALEKLRSGLAGESEPLRSVGVFLTEAKVKAKAMQMGLGDAHGELSEGAKVMARYQLILDETKTSQGDFARTSDGMANQQRITNAEMENLSATLGQKAQPAVISLQKGLIGLLTALEDLGPATDGTTRDVIQGLEEQTAALLKNGGTVEDVIKLQHQLAEVAPKAWTQSERDSINRSTAALSDFESSLGRAGKAYDDIVQPSEDAGAAMTGAAGQGSTAWADLAEAAEVASVKASTAADRTMRSYDDMVTDMTTRASDLIDRVYDPAIEHAELAADKEEAANLRRVINSKDSTDAEIKDAKRRLLSLSKNADEIRLALLESGNLTEEEQKEWLRKLRKHYKTATGQAKQDIADLITEIERLQGTTADPIKIRVVTLSGGKKGRGKATGGPVGEQGPETFVPDEPGTIVPNGQGSGGDTHFHLTVNGDLRATSEASVLATMQRLRSIGTRSFNGVR